MAFEEPVDPPADIEALLRKEMAAVPSAAFLPRVRGRIAAEEMRTSRWSWWMLVPAGALTAATALTISLSGVTGPVTPPPPPHRPVLQTGDPIARVMPLPANYPVARDNPARRRVPLPAIATAIGPPVLVDERQRAALHAVLRMVQLGSLTDAAFASTVAPSLQPIRDRVVPVGIDALAVSPIEPGGVLQIETEKDRPRP